MPKCLRNADASRSFSDRSRKKDAVKGRHLFGASSHTLSKNVPSTFAAPPLNLCAASKRCSFPRLFECQSAALYEIGYARGKLRKVQRQSLASLSTALRRGEVSYSSNSEWGQAKEAVTNHMNPAVLNHVHVFGQHFATVALLVYEEERNEGPSELVSVFPSNIEP